MCHLEGGPWLEITLRNFALITVPDTEHNPALPFGAVIEKKRKKIHMCIHARARPMETILGPGPHSRSSMVSLYLFQLPCCEEISG